MYSVQSLCRLVEVTSFFVTVSEQYIVSLNKEKTTVKNNTLVNDEPECRGVVVLRRGIPINRSAPSVVVTL